MVSPCKSLHTSLNKLIAAKTKSSAYDLMFCHSSWFETTQIVLFLKQTLLASQFESLNFNLLNRKLNSNTHLRMVYTHHYT